MMRGALRYLLSGVLLASPAVAAAQATGAPAPAAAAADDGTTSRLWAVAGAGFVALRGDCQTCEQDFPYRHDWGLLGNIGIRANRKMDVGAEVFWIPIDVGEQKAYVTHLDAVAQFRPWASQGFFVKGGAGMAFIRDFTDVPGGDSVRSKAFSVVIGGGWAFRPSARLGVQLFAAQHAAAMGDLQTSAGDIQDVLANFWSIGAAIVFR
jgi:hypothetical protein